MGLLWDHRSFRIQAHRSCRWSSLLHLQSTKVQRLPVSAIRSALLTRMAYSTHCVCPYDFSVGEWGKSHKLQTVPHDIQRIYTYRCGPHLPLPLVLPVCGWRQESVDGNHNARFCTLHHLSFVVGLTETYSSSREEVSSMSPLFSNQSLQVVIFGRLTRMISV